jgi:hypothetical protein
MISRSKEREKEREGERRREKEREGGRRRQGSIVAKKILLRKINKRNNGGHCFISAATY